jgi:cell division septation protein DedD
VRVAALLTAALVAATVPPASAQENPAIRMAVRLAAEGRGDSARRIVATELGKARPGESAYVEALYWRGKLAMSGDSAERDLRRVAIEFSTSRWADQALLQLAQLALAAGNPAGALQLAERLRSDYPGSPLRSRSALWAGRAAFEVGDPLVACALLDSARSEAAGDVEFANQVGFYRSRCPSSLPSPRASEQPAARSDTAGRAVPAPAAPATPTAKAEPAAAPLARTTQFEVQVGATRSSRAAHTLLSRVQQAGQRGRIVTGADKYLRVRAGPYATERDAAAAAEQLRRALGGHPYVVPAS